MTFNGVIALILHYFIEFDSFAGWLHHSGWRLTYGVRRMSSSSHIWPKLTHAAVAWSLCDSWASCLFTGSLVKTCVCVCVCVCPGVSNHLMQWLSPTLISVLSRQLVKVSDTLKYWNSEVTLLQECRYIHTYIHMLFVNRSGREWIRSTGLL